MTRNLSLVFVFTGFSLCFGAVYASDGSSPVKNTPKAEQTTAKDPAGMDLKAKEERLKAIQEELSALKKQDVQLRDAARNQYISLETFQTNVNTQDKEYIELKQDLMAAEQRVVELRSKLKKKTDSMPEFKDAAAKMTTIKSQMQDSNQKRTELLKEKSRLNSEIYAALKKDQPPVKAQEIPPVQPQPASGTVPASGAPMVGK